MVVVDALGVDFLTGVAMLDRNTAGVVAPDDLLPDNKVLIYYVLKEAGRSG